MNLAIRTFNHQQLYDRLNLPVDLINIIYEYTIEDQNEIIKRLAGEFHQMLRKNKQLSVRLADIALEYYHNNYFIIRFVDLSLIGGVRRTEYGSSFSIDRIIHVLSIRSFASIRSILQWIDRVDFAVNLGIRSFSKKNVTYMASFILGIHRYLDC